MDFPETGVMRVALQPAWRGFMALCVPVDEDVVQETLMRACQHQEVVDGNERPTRAWPFTVARDMISSNGSGAPEEGGSDELNSALDRTLVADAFARLSAEHRALVRRAYFYGWSTAQISADLRIAEGTVKSRLHYALRTLRRTLQEMRVEQ